ncbi:serine threonine- kinase Nek3 isoform X1 [Brachionus plicatilis]|uniref:non-specific serine/threonine protein kinase n=1 Tax=Brachionus plicatilis TaxID=10195 RepID=A0A3M7QNT7_BRAPC|nr:serine threonine- kinase Nek3 isoform X1 [Brachionus plicatilis]
MESNKRLWILPPIKVKPMLPSKQADSEPSLSETKTSMLKSSSILNRKLIIKLNSFNFVNDSLLKENAFKSHLGKVYPSIYSSSFNLPGSSRPVSNSLIYRFKDLKLGRFKRPVPMSKHSLLVEADNGKRYMFKLIDFMTDDYQKYSEMFRKLNHVSLTSINELVFGKKISYIISEYSDISLENFKLLNEHKFSFIDLFRQCLKACGFLHEHEILHANLKPSNVLLDRHGQVKLADFGYLNMSTNVVSFLLRLINDPVNRLYIPRETYHDFKYNKKSDLYALAAVFYHVITQEVFSFSQNSGPDRLCMIKNRSFRLVVKCMLAIIDHQRPDIDQILDFIDFEHEHTLLDTFSDKSSLVWYVDQKFVLKKFRTTSIQLKENLIKLDNLKHINLISLSKVINLSENFLCLRIYEQDYINLELKLKLSSLRESTLVKKWLTQILNGLNFLDQQALRHGNLNTNNILINLKTDLIKLSDFGYLHCLKEAELCDIFDLGKVLYKCVCLEDFDSEESVVSQRFKFANFSENLKSNVLNMLSPNRDLRPDLKTLTNNLINKILLKFQLNSSKMLTLLAKCESLMCTGCSLYAVGSTRKNFAESTSCYKIKLDKLTIENLDLNLSMVKKVRCKCEAVSRGQVQSPKLFCQIDLNYILGCNSDYFYLINEQFMCIRLMCIMELLESSKDQTHSSLVNRAHLRLCSQAMTYDRKHLKLYLLVTVHRKYFFMNIFNCELKKDSKDVKFELEVFKTLHINILDTSKSERKKVALNDKLVFVSDDWFIRIFDKNDFKYLFTVNSDPKYNQFVEQSVYFGSFRSDVFESDMHCVRKIEDIDVDSKGYLYVAFESLIKCYDQNGQFLWKFKFSKNVLNGKIKNICFSLTDLLFISICDSKNENLSKLLVFE